ncbi:hypothetical protein [Thalassotalea ganghwensis]
MNKDKLTIALDTLPTFVKVDGLSHYIEAKLTRTYFVFLAYLCIGIAFFAGLTGIFGPSSIIVGSRLSIGEFWLLYPGPILSVAMLLAMAFHYLSQPKPLSDVNGFFAEHIKLSVDSKVLERDDYYVELIGDNGFIIVKSKDDAMEFMLAFCDSLEQRVEEKLERIEQSLLLLEKGE